MFGPSHGYPLTTKSCLRIYHWLKSDTLIERKNMKRTKGFANRLVTFVVLFVVTIFSTNLHAQVFPGKAKVKAIKGSASFSLPGENAKPLKVGTTLTSGSVVKTDGKSSVDLFLGNSAGVVRMTENSTLALDKLTLLDTGADTVVEIQLNVAQGTILGNVNKLSVASRYEIKVPNGIASIRGTQFRAGADGNLVLLQGTLVFAYVPPTGDPVPYTLTGPPAVYFTPVEGVQLAPPALVREVQRQVGKTANEIDSSSTRLLHKETFVSPETGQAP